MSYPALHIHREPFLADWDSAARVEPPPPECNDTEADRRARVAALYREARHLSALIDDLTPQAGRAARTGDIDGLLATKREIEAAKRDLRAVYARLEEDRRAVDAALDGASTPRPPRPFVAAACGSVTVDRVADYLAEDED